MIGQVCTAGSHVAGISVSTGSGHGLVGLPNAPAPRLPAGGLAVAALGGLLFVAGVGRRRRRRHAAGGSR